MLYICHICILCATFSITVGLGRGRRAEGSSVVRERERETGVQAQFDWMLNGDTIGFHLVSL
jgi:hypothetical protein